MNDPVLVKSLSPAHSLVLLLLVGLAISGWFYGIHWKRVASGVLFSSEEKLMIRLQDQIRSLTETNVSLNEQLKAFADAADGPGLADGAAPVPVAPEAAVVLPVLGPAQDTPLLPTRPQKVETH